MSGLNLIMFICLDAHFLLSMMPHHAKSRPFWTFHDKLHNMKALVILNHHDHHFSHLPCFHEKINFCESLLALLEYFRETKLRTAHCFNIGAHIGICAQISRNTLLYLPCLKRESLILLLMLISTWLTVSRAFNSDENLFMSNIINHCKNHVKWRISI